MDPLLPGVIQTAVWTAQQSETSSDGCRLLKSCLQTLEHCLSLFHFRKTAAGCEKLPANTGSISKILCLLFHGSSHQRLFGLQHFIFDHCYVLEYLPTRQYLFARCPFVAAIYIISLLSIDHHTLYIYTHNSMSYTQSDSPDAYIWF